MNTKHKLYIDFCSYDAALYACKNWHYSKCIPAAGTVKFGVWENNNYIGTIIYSKGASPHLLKKYKLKHTEGCELTRIALKSHIFPVSKMIAITITLLKKFCPKLKLIISFADPSQGHYGGIYQATNWIYTGKTNPAYFYKAGNKLYHPRSARNKKTKNRAELWAKKVYMGGKYRYLMPLTKEMRNEVIHLQLPYPKNKAVEIGDGYDQ